MKDWINGEEGICNPDKLAGIIIMEETGAPLPFKVVGLLPDGRVHILIGWFATRSQAHLHIQEIKEGKHAG